MNKLLISSLLMLSVLSANASKTPAIDEAAQKAIAAVSEVARAEGRAAAAAALTAQSDVPLIEQGVRGVVGGLLKGIGGLINVMYEHPLLTMTLGTAAGIYCFVKYQPVRHFAFMQLPTRVQTVCNALYGLTAPEIVPASADQVQEIVVAHTQAAEESRTAIQALQNQLHGAIGQLNAIRAGTAHAQEAQQTALSTQIAHIQQDLLTAQQEHVRVLEQQQKETEERMTRAFQENLRTQLARHAAALQAQQQDARRELDQHVQEFSLQLATLQATVERLCTATQAGFTGLAQEVHRQTPSLLGPVGSIRYGDHVLNPSIPRPMSMPDIVRESDRRSRQPFVLSGNLADLAGFGLGRTRPLPLLPLTLRK